MTKIFVGIAIWTKLAIPNRKIQYIIKVKF